MRQQGLAVEHIQGLHQRIAVAGPGMNLDACRAQRFDSLVYRAAGDAQFTREHGAGHCTLAKTFEQGTITHSASRENNFRHTRAFSKRDSVPARKRKTLLRWV